MGEEILLPRTKNSPNDLKLYKSLSSLIKEYRQWRNMTQETLAESIQISVRELQNWEADRRRARIENLHDLAEFTGIPMKTLVALNADQPVWYSLRNRLFMYSSLEKKQFSSHELFRHDEPSNLEVLNITTDKHMKSILSCHCDIYRTKRELRRDVIKAATEILPEQNIIVFDHWGHYVGHKICLPMKPDAYQQLKKQEFLEDFLTVDKIHNIFSLGEGIFFFYSLFVSNVSVASRLVLDITKSLAKINETKRYLVASQVATPESQKLETHLGMISAKKYLQLYDEVSPGINEIGLDALVAPTGPYGPLLNMLGLTPEQESAGDLIKEAKMEEPSDIRCQNPDEISQISETSSDMSGHDLPLSVGETPQSVGEKEIENQNRKTPPVNPEIIACTNSTCSLYGKLRKGNIISNGTYQTKTGTPGRRFYCKRCGKSFCSRTGTLFYGLKSPEEKVLNALKHLAKGMPLQGVAKALGVKFDTIRRWLEVAAGQSEKIDAVLIKEPDISQTDLNALWTFVRTKTLRRRSIRLRSKQKPR